MENKRERRERTKLDILQCQSYQQKENQRYTKLFGNFLNKKV
jgi:hypothetical protein